MLPLPPNKKPWPHRGAEVVFRAGAHHLLRMALNKPFSLPQHLSLKYWLAKRQAEGPAFGYNTRTHGKRGRGGREEDITQAHTQGAAGVGPGEVTACEGGPGKAEVPTSP